VELAGVIVFVLVGLGLAAAIWIVSQSFASEALPAIQPSCPYCPGVFPALTWVPLVGATARCTNCRRSLGRGRWAYEIGMGAAFGVAASRMESGGALIEFALFAAVLSVVMLTDFWSGTVYRNLVIGGMAIALVTAIVRGWDPFVHSLQGLLAGIVIFGVGMLVLRKILPVMQLAPIGGGDVLIAGMIGAMALWPGTLFAFFAGVALAAAGAAVVLFLQRSVRVGPQPFGPFLCAAAIAVFAFTF
jgi:prepilin signal peptidase PulO-like enzyme (type II secretory pathway)